LKYQLKNISAQIILLYNFAIFIFFIYDGDTIVILFNCFRKKTQKTPYSEIKKAIKLKNEYYYGQDE